MVNLHNKEYFINNIITSKTYTNVIKVIIGVMALFASAQIMIPIQPVPITLQTMMVSIIAFTYKPHVSFTTVLVYISVGLMGVPMFAKLSGGLHYFMGATCGYLIGMLIATPVMSMLSIKYSQKFLGVFCACLIGHVIIYLLGVCWLATIIGAEKALYSGFIVYIPTGIVKILIFSYLYSYIKGRSGRYFG
jgi:biotin transport system substrate-specific component